MVDGPSPAHLVEAHDLDDPRLEVEDLLVPDAHAHLVHRRPVHDLRLEALVDLIHDALRDCLRAEEGQSARARGCEDKGRERGLGTDERGRGRGGGEAETQERRR